MNNSYLDEDGRIIVDHTGREYDPATMAPENLHEAITYHDWSSRQDAKAAKEMLRAWSRSS